MFNFMAKIHKIRFRLGLRPRPLWEAYSSPPDPLAGLREPTSKAREGREKDGMGKEEEREGGNGREGKGS